MSSRWFTFVFLLLSACQPTPIELDGDELFRKKKGPTWSNGVAGIIREHCVTCHREGETAAVRPFQTYDDVVASANEIVDRITGALPREWTMPPYTPGETATCEPEHPYANDARLTAAEITSIEDWVNDGVPKGTGVVTEPLIPTLVVEEMVDGTLYAFDEGYEMAHYSTDDNMLDFYPCVIVDPGEIEESRWLSGLQIEPDVHQLFQGADVRLDPDRESLAFVDAASPYDHGATWYDCPDGFGFEGQPLASFMPGTSADANGLVRVPAFETPAGSAVEIGGDALIVYRVHYHSHYENLDINDTSPLPDPILRTDHTSLAIRWEDEADVIDTAQLFHFGNDSVNNGDGTGLLTAPFSIPSLKVDHVETMAATVPGTSADTYAVFSAQPSVRGLGITVEVSVTPVGGTAECLGAVPEWHTSWQVTGRYSDEVGAQPVVHGGDLVKVQCTYSNPLTVAVGLGTGADQELCEATLGLLPIQ